MDLPTDHKNLERYKTLGSEDAFREIVDRHLGLVYHTACRELCDHSVAEDVVQRVFSLLARKSRGGFTIRRSLAGWLYQTTLNECAATRRSDGTRRKYMEAYQEHLKVEQDGKSTWINLLPGLNAALQELPESDRELILLRFYQGLDFQEIARTTGKTAAACQRRTHRALEKLRSNLAPELERSSRVNAASLGAAIGLAFSGSLPETLASSVMKKSVFITGSIVPSSRVTGNPWNIKLALGIVVGGAVPLLMGVFYLQHIRAEIVRVTVEQTEAGSPVSLELRRLPGRDRSHAMTANEMLDEIALGKAVGDRLVEGTYRERTFLDHDAARLKTLLIESEELVGEDLPRIALSAFLLRPLAAKDPPFALHYVLIEKPARRFTGEIAAMAIAEWMKQDSISATAWFEEHADGFPIHGLESDVNSDVTLGMIRALVDKKNVVEAVRLAETLNETYGGRAALEIAPVALQSTTPKAFYAMISNVRISSKKRAELERRIQRGIQRGIWK